MQKMRQPLDISFREFEKIIQQRLYGIFGVLPGQVKVLFVHAEGDDISFFVKFVSGEPHGTCIYVHLQFDASVCDYIYDITDLQTMKKSVLKQVSTH